MRKEIKKKEKVLQNINIQLRKCPEGSLTSQVKGEKVYYYHQMSGKTTYIKKKDIKFAKQLAQKEYWQKVKQVLQMQLDTLKQFDETYDETALEQIYGNFPEERKQLVTPIVSGVKEKLKVWNEEAYEPYNAYPEYKIYETDRGEMVRSKSEVIIANILNQHKKHLDYKYERPLELRDKSGREIIIHPDFTIINKHTGKIYYYEHAGKLDEPRYAMDFVKKIELYTVNNIMQGRDLLITYEAAGAPLSVGCVRKVLDNICGT